MRGTVVRIDVERLPKPTRPGQEDPVAVVVRARTPGLDVCWRAYLRRFDVEHTYRFAKNTSAWASAACYSSRQRIVVAETWWSAASA
ncbi:MAG: hypothetical protein ACRDYA_16915 [Egibacteraceae bacterium]